MFAPRATTLHPDQRLIVDIRLACDFSLDTWCLLKAKSSFTHHYVVTILGGVVDGSYQGRIKVILWNIGPQLVIVPQHAPFCQAILMPSIRCSFVRGGGSRATRRGCDARVRHDLSHPLRLQGNDQQRGFVPVERHH